MLDQQRWQSFIESIGGREKLVALVEESVLDPEKSSDPEIWDELAALYESNPIAKAEMRDIAARLALRDELERGEEAARKTADPQKTPR